MAPIELSAGWLYRTRRWERGGRIYERVFRIRAWKRHLPDGAALARSSRS